MAQRMQNALLSATCFLCMIYVTFCSPRLPESPHKPEAGPNVGELEPMPPEQMEHLLQLQASDEDAEKRGDWNKLSGVWGKRGGDWNKLSGVWGKRNDWNKLSGVWGKREGDWNKLSGVWGKRGGDWNKLSGVWGKRGGDWNKLSGVWGKRESGDLPPYGGKRGWNNLSNMWGKRSSSRDDGSKRTTNWNNLKSVWGKRDAEWEIPSMWDKFSAEDDMYPAIYVPEQM